MAEKKSYNEYLAMLADEEQSLSKRIIKQFSNLESEQQAQFEQAWGTFSVERRREIAEALVEYAEEQVEEDFNPLFLYMLRDPDAKVRVIALEGLWEYEEHNMLRMLIPLMESDPSEEVREKATISMSRFALLAELGKLPSRWNKNVHDSLMTQFQKKTNSLEVRRRALEALGYFSQDEQVRQFIAEAYQSDDELFKSSALAAMGRTVDKRWLPEIGQELSNESPALRYEAVRAAGEQSSTELLTPLLRLTRDHDPEVRLAAIWALGQVGGQEATRTLKVLAESESTTIREAAKEALAEIVFSQNPLNVIDY
ncbi:MAG: HEAT repeat domain-containing protein [Chloroflexi bacterium]|uniref:HEAT repeat domain-containing protein n=1 Tax=Candidatus Chlorohelix allophototropha TaxID=3003348 RepID=A0A8T7M9D3_9CHLR|nr:HEAT repeat domain-containing protein [Chloroflexota bacterium]NWJ48788.1 HEAT repeat domain-containing protein [Chloroflexota bacterium]WJW68719.1 HEAT repeat domain-containing protein [Chloroflexota bacterium L227-S17]